MATTTMCECEDRGILHIQTHPGITTIEQCTCRPPEYWKQKHDENWNLFLSNLQKAKDDLGLVDDVQREVAGRQKY